MNKVFNLFSILLLFIVLAACQDDSSQPDKNIRVENGGIFIPISLKVNGVESSGTLDLGEYVTGSDPVVLELDLTNNTEYPLKEIALNFPGRISKFYDFYQEDEGEGVFPGSGGTCKETLAAKKSCKIFLSFSANKSGLYAQNIELRYRNLIENEGKTFTFETVAGQPASLIFDDGSTNNFFFGNKVGAAQKPVLERSEVQNYHRKLIMSNRGELTARDVSISLPFSCSSSDEGFSGSLTSYTKDASPPKNFCDAWIMSHNCPPSLAPAESCEIEVTFTPTNQDQSWGFDNVLDEVYFSSKVNVSYKDTPDINVTSLRGNFESYSTTIAARFETSKADVTFEDEVTVGNFVADIFQIKNVGYRDGEVLSFEFVKNDGTKDGVDRTFCVLTDSSTTYLKCFDETLTIELGLNEFPFIVSQRGECFTSPSHFSNYIDIDEQCILDIRFQPSLEYKERKSFGYDLLLNYDSRWKGNELLRQKDLFDVSSSSLHAGVLVVSKVEFDGTSKDLLGRIINENIDESVDLGRLALLSKGYETYRPIKITFQNIGGASVDIYKAFSGIASGQMGLTELDSVTNKTVGNYTTKYFKDIKIDQSNCGSLGVLIGDPSGSAQSKCVVSMLFAPVSMDTTAEQNESMFDLMTGVSPLKIFSMKYHDQSNFTDTNIESTIPDIDKTNTLAWKEVHLGIKAQLIEKGFLADYSTQSKSIPALYRDNTEYLNFKFQNIGTGPISWIPYKGNYIDAEGTPFLGDGIERVAVASPSDYGADYDCNDVFDFDFTGFDADGDGTANTSSDVTTIQNRLAGKSVLNKLESCVLRLKVSDTTRYYSEGESIAAAEEDLITQYFYSDLLNNTEQAYFIATGLRQQITKSIEASFFDGDASGQVASGSTNEFNRNFGEYFEVGSSHLKGAISANAVFFEQAKLIPTDPKPYMSAVIYRPSVDFPGFSNVINGTTVNVGANSVVARYYSALNTENNHADCYFFQSCFSPSYVENSRLSGDFDTANIDYIVHAGSFPVGQNIPFSFSISNAGKFMTVLSGESLVGDPEIDFDTSYSSANGRNVGATNVTRGLATVGAKEVKLNLNAPSPGVYSSVYTIQYVTGRGNTNTSMELKVKVVAEVISAIPEIKIEYSDYDADNNLIGTRYALGTGLNHTEAASGLLLDAVQMTEADPNGPALKKRLYLKNTGTASATTVSLRFNDDPLATSPTNLVGIGPLSNKSIKVIESDCDFVNSFTITTNSECYMDIWYQPVLKDSPEELSLSINYDTGASRNQFIQENVLLSFAPLSPSVLELASTPLQNIQYRDREDSNLLKSGQKAYILNLGTVTYDQVNKAYTVVKEVLNPGVDTRASLVRQYEKYQSISNPNLAPSDVTYDGSGYTQIYGANNVSVFANEVCLFGGTAESSLPDSQKGFNGDTSEKCYFKFVFTPGINIIGKSLSFTEVDDVSENYFYLEYYNNKRDSFDKIFMTFTGKFLPPSSSLSATPAYFDVEAISGGEISFSWNHLDPNSAALGPVVGYRVFYTRYPNEIASLFDVLEKNPNFIDVLSDNYTVINNSYIQDLTSYYINIMAIRYNPSYTAGLFPSLASGLFLSEATGIKTKITTPSLEFFYDYEAHSLITYDKESGIHDFFEAIDTCENLGSILISENGTSVEGFYKLINQEAWDAIEFDFNSTTDYGGANPRGIPHWLDEGLSFNIDAIFGGGGVVGYDSSKTYQRFEVEGLFYIRPSGETQATYGANVAKTEGGVFNYLDYEGYVSPTVKEGFARCFVPLNR